MVTFSQNPRMSKTFVTIAKFTGKEWEIATDSSFLSVRTGFNFLIFYRKSGKTGNTG